MPPKTALVARTVGAKGSFPVQFGFLGAHTGVMVTPSAPAMANRTQKARTALSRGGAKSRPTEPRCPRSCQHSGHVAGGPVKAADINPGQDHAGERDQSLLPVWWRKGKGLRPS